VLAKRLVEFLELTHLLGVDQVFFYDFHVNDQVQRVLDYYKEKVQSKSKSKSRSNVFTKVILM
jgi:hypothetical protein